MVVRARGVFVAAVWLCAFAGCDTLFAERVLERWCDGVICGAPHSLTWKNPTEFWLYDRPAAQRLDGRWKKQSPCGELGAAIALASDTAGTWAVCEFGDTKALVRRPTGGAAEQVPVPSMPALIDLHDDVLFGWADGFYAWDGSGFTLVVPPQPQRLGLWWGGRSRSDFYFEGKWWNGASWQPVDGTHNLSRLGGYVLDGRFCVGGRYLLEGTSVTDLYVAQGGVGATKQQSAVVFAAWGCERLWMLSWDVEEAVLSRLDDGHLVRVGHLPEPLYTPGPEGLHIAVWGIAVSPDRVLVNDRDDFYELHVQ